MNSCEKRGDKLYVYNEAGTCIYVWENVLDYRIKQDSHSSTVAVLVKFKDGRKIAWDMKTTDVLHYVVSRFDAYWE